MVNYDENLIKVTTYEPYGELPDPFLLPDGSRISKKEDWPAVRREMFKTAIELQYGTMPPAPEYQKFERLDEGGRFQSYRITAGTREKTISFIVRIMVSPDVSKPLPAIVDGDLCFNYYFRNDQYEQINKEKVHLVLFSRLEIVPDVKCEHHRGGGLYDVYPDHTFGALGAWAWGYSRCVDLLETLDFIDTSCIVFSGHSRGAKTALLAGVLDERAAIVNPNETCAGGASCYRLFMRAITEDGDEMHSELLRDLWKNYGFWMGPKMGEYADRPQDLPFDCHFMKAMVAPRILFVSEAASDIWANPIGSWMTTMAAGEVYKFLEKPENLYWYYRRGYHAHAPEDFQMLLNLIKHHKEGAPLSENFFHTPFRKPELMYSWRAPESKE